MPDGYVRSLLHTASLHCGKVLSFVWRARLHPNSSIACMDGGDGNGGDCGRDDMRNSPHPKSGDTALFSSVCCTPHRSVGLVQISKTACGEFSNGFREEFGARRGRNKR